LVTRLDYPKKKKKISCEGSNSATIAFNEAMTNILNNDQSIKALSKKNSKKK
jgi:hypothetical protein